MSATCRDGSVNGNIATRIDIHIQYARFRGRHDRIADRHITGSGTRRRQSVSCSGAIRQIDGRPTRQRIRLIQGQLNGVRINNNDGISISGRQATDRGAATVIVNHQIARLEIMGSPCDLLQSVIHTTGTVERHIRDRSLCIKRNDAPFVIRDPVRRAIAAFGVKRCTRLSRNVAVMRTDRDIAALPWRCVIDPTCIHKSLKIDVATGIHCHVTGIFVGFVARRRDVARRCTQNVAARIHVHVATERRNWCVDVRIAISVDVDVGSGGQFGGCVDIPVNRHITVCATRISVNRMQRDNAAFSVRKKICIVRITTHCTDRGGGDIAV